MWKNSIGLDEEILVSSETCAIIVLSDSFAWFRPKIVTLRQLALHRSCA